MESTSGIGSYDTITVDPAGLMDTGAPPIETASISARVSRQLVVNAEEIQASFVDGRLRLRCDHGQPVFPFTLGYNLVGCDLELMGPRSPSMTKPGSWPGHVAATACDGLLEPDAGHLAEHVREIEPTGAEAVCDYKDDKITCSAWKILSLWGASVALRVSQRGWTSRSSTSWLSSQRMNGRHYEFHEQFCGSRSRPEEEAHLRGCGGGVPDTVPDRGPVRVGSDRSCDEHRLPQFPQPTLAPPKVVGGGSRGRLHISVGPVGDRSGPGAEPLQRHQPSACLDHLTRWSRRRGSLSRAGVDPPTTADSSLATQNQC